MAAFKNKTKGNVKPNGKPRVYFTCHPMDFDVYFEKLTDDILNAHDCAIYYTPDMTEVIEEELCYDESYSYNRDRDISIIKWEYKGFLIFKWFEIKYIEGNIMNKLQ